MKILHLTDKVNGGPMPIIADQIVAIDDQPRGQCLITLSDGTTRQPVESVEDVTKLLEATE